MKVYFIFASPPVALMQVNTSAAQLSLGGWVDEPDILKDLTKEKAERNILSKGRKWQALEQFLCLAVRHGPCP